MPSGGELVVREGQWPARVDAPPPAQSPTAGPGARNDTDWTDPPASPRPAIPVSQSRREMEEVRARTAEAGRLLHQGELSGAKAAYDRLIELATEYERGAGVYRKQKEDARLMSRTLEVRLAEREARRASNAPQGGTDGEILFAAPMTVEQSARTGPGTTQDSGEARHYADLSPAERWELDRERVESSGTEGPAASAFMAPTGPPASPPSTPEVAPVTPLPAKDSSPANSKVLLYLGTVSTEDRARVARDDCPVPDGGACITMMRPGDLQTDAKTFQYKEATDDQGVSVKLRDVKQWDPDLAGVAYVWERADGRRFVVDGHQRLALARRMRAEGQDPALLVKFWREADGYTPRYMRLVAAKKNIAEDSGTAVDAARVLREEPNLFDTLSQTGAKVRDARGLAKLTPAVFNEAAEYVNAGRLPENVAAVVSRVGENEEMQRGVLLELVRAQREGHLTPDEAGQLVYVVRRSMLDQEARKLQGAMPGFDVGAVRESAWRERDALTRGVLNAFKGTRLVLRAVERGETKLEGLGNVLAAEANAGELDAAQKSIAVVEVLAESQGPLADYLDHQARRVKEQMDAEGIGRRRAVGPFVTQAVDYLRPYLESYLEDNGEALRADLEARGSAAAERVDLSASSPGPAASSASAGPEDGPPKPAVPAGEQVNLGNEFATNAQTDMVMPSFDKGARAGPLTAPPPRPERGQVHFPPQVSGNLLTADSPEMEVVPIRPKAPRRLEKPDPSAGSVKPVRSRREAGQQPETQPETPEKAGPRRRPAPAPTRRAVRPVPKAASVAKPGRRVNPLSEHPLARLGRRKHGVR